MGKRQRNRLRKAGLHKYPNEPKDFLFELRHDKALEGIELREANDEALGELVSHATKGRSGG